MQGDNEKVELDIKELERLEAIDIVAQANRQDIQIIANTFCVCQGCGTNIKLLPEVETTNERVRHLTGELKRLKQKLTLYEEGKLQLDNKLLRSLNDSIY
jgi:hypothetical protein